MNGTIHSIPGYCTSGTGIHTPGQWLTCARLGWHEPTTTAANAGYFAGHNIAPVLAVAILTVLVLVLFRGRRGRPEPETAPRARAGVRR